MVAVQPVVCDPTLLAQWRAGASDAARIVLVADYLCSELAFVLGIKRQEIDAAEDFRSLGLTSLTGLELATRFHRRLGLTLEPGLIALHPSAISLAVPIAKKLALIPMQQNAPDTAEASDR
jgi:hypothetical protein